MKKTDYYCKTCKIYFMSGDDLRDHLGLKDKKGKFVNIGHVGIDLEFQKEFNKIWK